MQMEPREPVVAESYPTFWDDLHPAPVALPVAPEDAYTTFVNLIEDGITTGGDARPD